MKQTLKAILARFNGDALKAFSYCDTIAQTASSADIRAEYKALAKQIWDDVSKSEAAHA